MTTSLLCSMWMWCGM